LGLAAIIRENHLSALKPGPNHAPDVERRGVGSERVEADQVPDSLAHQG
jgi:hypothetical protein